MVKVCVNPGVCGLLTTLTVERSNAKTVLVDTQSQCEAIRKIGADLGELDAYHEIFSKFGESTVFKIAQVHIKHAACPVPTAILKGIEAECGLALPRDVHIEITKETPKN